LNFEEREIKNKNKLKNHLEIAKYIYIEEIEIKTESFTSSPRIYIVMSENIDTAPLRSDSFFRPAFIYSTLI